MWQMFSDMNSNKWKSVNTTIIVNCFKKKDSEKDHRIIICVVLEQDRGLMNLDGCCERQETNNSGIVFLGKCVLRICNDIL